MTSVLLFHADPSMKARYEAALPGARLAIVLSHGSQFSAGYDLPAGFAGQFRTLPALLAKYDPAWREGEPLVLIGYSAGCFAMRAYLRSADDRARTTAAVFLDGLHASGSDHLADAGPIAGVVAYARDVWASLGARALVVSHTQIVPPGYASTRATANRLLAELGCARPSTMDALDVGGLSVRPYPGGDASAHAHQLQSVGPALLHALVAPLLAAAPAPPPAPPAAPPAACDSRTLGERAVDWSLSQQRAGVHEQPAGSNSGPEIRGYFAPCRRRGTEVKLGISSGNWCCAGACAAMAAAALPGEALPHGYRAGVVEVQADLAAAGLWRPAAVVRAGGYTPRRGDVAIYDRSTPGKPETSWYRHINRVTLWRGDRTFQTIGANEGNRWSTGEHDVHEPRLLGFGAYPAAGVVCEDHDDPALASLEQALAASDGTEAG